MAKKADKAGATSKAKPPPLAPAGATLVPSANATAGPKKAKSSAGTGSALLLPALVVCVAAIALGGGLFSQLSQQPAPAETRAQLESLSLKELLAKVHSSPDTTQLDTTHLTEDELDLAMEMDDPKEAIVAALMEYRGVAAVEGALGLVASARHLPASCGVLVMLTEGGYGCGNPDDGEQEGAGELRQGARCRRISESYASVRDAGAVEPFPRPFPAPFQLHFDALSSRVFRLTFCQISS